METTVLVILANNAREMRPSQIDFADVVVIQGPFQMNDASETCYARYE